MRSAFFLAVCGVGVAILVGCEAPRRASSPTSRAPADEVKEKVMCLPVWLPDNSAYQMIRGHFWATYRPKGVGSQILYASRAGSIIEQFTRPDACPAEKVLTKEERQHLLAGEVVVKRLAGTSHGWTKIGSVWVYLSSPSASTSELSEILKEYRTRYRQMVSKEPSVKRELGAPEVLVRRYWDYVEFDSLVSSE